jgi:hypothetical protein
MKNESKFAPTDRIMDIYRACYPRWQVWKIAHSMELESSLLDLNREFGIDDVKLLEMTLGEIVKKMSAPRTTNQYDAT